MNGREAKSSQLESQQPSPSPPAPSLKSSCCSIQERTSSYFNSSNLKSTEEDSRENNNMDGSTEEDMEEPENTKLGTEESSNVDNKNWKNNMEGSTIMP